MSYTRAHDFLQETTRIRPLWI